MRRNWLNSAEFSGITPEKVQQRARVLGEQSGRATPVGKSDHLANLNSSTSDTSSPTTSRPTSTT